MKAMGSEEDQESEHRSHSELQVAPAPVSPTLSSMSLLMRAMSSCEMLCSDVPVMAPSVVSPSCHPDGERNSEDRLTAAC